MIHDNEIHYCKLIKPLESAEPGFLDPIIIYNSVRYQPLGLSYDQ
jgi:hypothetical protein